jgi:two-component system, cell cycle sensor histidine kinase and response regulator CckA
MSSVAGHGRDGIEALLAGRNRILEMIATNAPLDETLASLVLLIESQFNETVCSIVLLEEDGQHIRHAAGPNLPHSYREAIDGSLIGPNAGSCGAAMFRKEPVITTDILKDPLWDNYRALATRHGLRACWSTPIASHQGKILGSFAMYYREPRSPIPAELELTNLATFMAGIAIERWQVDLERRRAVENYRALVENLNDVVFSLDAEGRFSYVSPIIESITGYTVSEVVGRPFTSFVHPEDLPSLQKSFANTAAGIEAPFEFRVFSKTGKVLWCRSSSRRVLSGDRVVGITGIVQDITERKLLEKQLVQAQKMEAVGRLAGGIAHDFNNVLGVILGQGELLLQKLAPTDSSRRRVEQICQAGRRAASLTGQLLAFSRQQILQPASLNLNDVVNGFSNMLATMIGEDVTFLKLLDPNLWRVSADAGQVEQVLMNLVVNARDAMPAGGAITIRTSNMELDELFVRQHPGTRPGRCVVLMVSDTGVGMDEETAVHIFEPFFTTKEAGKGTGLGLPTVYGIVKQSGGYISVASHLRKGTTFSIYLPRVEEAMAENGGEKSAAPVRGSETVLLVEDALALREVTREFLQGAGYTVLEAGDATEALQTAECHGANISLLITDVVLPGINGRALAQQLLSLRPEMKVLYISGYTDDAMVRHGLLQSEIAFLEKPFTQNALTHKVREILDAQI